MTAPVVRVRNLCKSLGQTEVLRGVSFDVLPEETFVIMGPSGTGKSVLLKHLVGLLRPDAGEIFLWDRPVHALAEDEFNALRQRMGVVFQSAALFDSLTVGENVAFPLRRHRRMSEVMVREAVAALLELVGLEKTAAMMPAELSGGMRKRVAIARALALNPELMCYDEPTTGLDPPAAREIDRLIWRLQAELGMTSIVVTHDLETAFGIGTRNAVMAAGELLAVGTPGEIQADPRPQIRQFIHPGAVRG